MNSTRPPRTYSLGRLLYDRGLWKQAIYAVAFLTYLASFLFFVLSWFVERRRNRLAIAFPDRRSDQGESDVTSSQLVS